MDKKHEEQANRSVGYLKQPKLSWTLPLYNNLLCFAIQKSNHRPKEHSVAMGRPQLFCPQIAISKIFFLSSDASFLYDEQQITRRKWEIINRHCFCTQSLPAGVHSIQTLQQGQFRSDWGVCPPSASARLLLLRAYLAYNNISHRSMQLMEQRIRGVNFDGSVRLSEAVLSLEVIEFVSGQIYRFQATPDQLTISFKQFLVIKRLDELFEELVGNHDSFISKEETLIIPIAVQYRGRIEALNVEVGLEKVPIEDERQLNLKYLKEIERMSKENLTIDRYKEKAIRFKPDLNSTIIKCFELVPQRNLIRYSANNQHSIINHAQPLPRVGIHSFKARILKTYSKNIIFGICSFDIRYTINNYHSPYFLGLSLSEKTVLGNNKSDVAIQPVDIVEGKSVVKVEVDMNKSVISWFLDDGFLCARRIPGDISSKDVYAIISLYNLGDTLEMIA